VHGRAALCEDIWIKLVGNVAFTPLSATMAEIFAHVYTGAVVAAMMAETVARAAGTEPSVSIEKRIDGARRVGHHKTSMLQDLEAGNAPEIEVIIGAVVELAALTGIPAPTLRNVRAAVDLLARNRAPAAPDRPLWTDLVHVQMAVSRDRSPGVSRRWFGRVNPRR
jgi:2-dehydropantoate 2-reductase